MAHEHRDEPERRKVLKGLGIGVMALPFTAGRTAAQQDSLRISVEAGEGDLNNWTSRNLLTDEFRGKIDVSGIQSNEIAYMMVPTGPDGGFIDGIRHGTPSREDNSNTTRLSGDQGEIINSTSWDPTGTILSSSWTNGIYYLYAVVADSNREAFGVAISDPFEIDT